MTIIGKRSKLSLINTSLSEEFKLEYNARGRDIINFKEGNKLMAPAKKTTTKPEVKAAEAAVKTTVLKADEEAAAKSAAKKEEKKAAASVAEKAADVKKESGRRGPAKKAKKATAKKADLKTSVCLQFAGKSYTEEDLVKIARDVWKYDLKQKLGDLVSVELYVKPEENTVYYVMNKNFEGRFNI